MTRNNLTTASAFFDPWMHQSFGLDNIFQALQQFDRNPPAKYPPHNIIRNGDKYVLEFALSGWKESELKVELEKNILRITGTKAESENEDSEQSFVHKGIANRSFMSQFTIGDNINIVDGKLEDGVLTINMDIVIPEEDKPKTIKIVSS